MKRIVIGLIAGCVLIGAAIYTNATVEAAEPYAVLTVRSAVEDEEVTFKGIYFSAVGDLNEAVKPRQTPFQMRVDAEQFVALFRKLDGEADLDVQLTQAEGSTTLRGSAGATGTVCLVMRRSDGGLNSAVL